MVSALNPTLSHAFGESTRFSCGFIRYSTELASRCLDFRLGSIGRLRNFGPGLVLTLFPLLSGFVRNAATHRRYQEYKTKHSRKLYGSNRSNHLEKSRTSYKQRLAMADHTAKRVGVNN